MNEVNPNPQQIQELQQLPKTQAVCMLNILRFKKKTETDESGLVAYHRYMKNVTPFLKEAGGTLVWKGKTMHTFIGDSFNQPDMVFIVSYPSIDNFLKMISNPAYIEVAKDRTLALEYGGLFVMNPIR